MSGRSYSSGGRVMLVLVVVLALAACGLVDDETGEVDAEAMGADQTDAVDDEETEENGEPGQAREPLEPAEAELPADQSLDLQTNHRNGVVFTVTGIRFFSDRIEVGVDIQNGHEGTVALEGSEAGDQELHLEDDTGTTYKLGRPDNELFDPRLKLEEGQRVQGTLVFLGRLDADAEALTLLSWGGDESSFADSLSPNTAVEFDLPVEWE